ncbi:hypothetical protein [Streptodolium elevatio]
MATTLRTPTRQTARVPAARGIGIFAVTTAKVVLLGKHGID